MVDGAVVASVGATFAIKPRRVVPDPEAVAGDPGPDRAGPERAPVGLPGVRVRHLPAVRRGGGAGAGVACASARRTRSAGRTRPSGRRRWTRMTGLSTYRVLRDRLAFEVERGKRSAEGFAVLFLDLDRFKEVNDQYGHEAGNEILRAVAGEIRNAVRASDVAARYGGDEFVVILTRTDLQGGARVAEALRAGIEGVGRRLGYPAGLITVSVGLAEFDPREPSEGDLLVSADRALYRAKAAGRNAVA